MDSNGISITPKSEVNDPQTGVNDPQTGVNDPQTGVNDPQMGVNDPQMGVIKHNLVKSVKKKKKYQCQYCHKLLSKSCHLTRHYKTCKVKKKKYRI